MKDKNMNERIDNLIEFRSFSISSCPLPLIKNFKEFCQYETKGDYSMGLKILLERNNMNFQQELFAIKIKELDNRLREIEQKEHEQGEKKSKTFGSKDKKEEVDEE
jgi:transcription antitermination factor NusA-like protein